MLTEQHYVHTVHSKRNFAFGSRCYILSCHGDFIRGQEIKDWQS